MSGMGWARYHVEPPYVATIYNGVNVRRFAPVRDAQIRSEDVVITAAAYLIAEKGTRAASSGRVAICPAFVSTSLATARKKLGPVPSHRPSVSGKSRASSLAE
jgi:hypothetical protein